ncbi:MAG: FAD:protein FMN transferase [Clostridia bacterium]|nr:FAD:protein FMN transferase [Clostridia bacterium]
MRKKTLFPRLFSAFFLPFLLFALFPSCGQRSAEATVFAMDTAAILRLEGEGAEEVLPLLTAELDRLNGLLDAEGEALSALRRGSSVRDPEIVSLLRAAAEVSEKTGGAMDVTVNPAVEAWGFRSGDYRVPQEEELRSLREKTGWESISFHGGAVSLPEGFSLTLGAVAKGYAGDRLREIAEENGIRRGVLSLGGNVILLGDKAAGKDWSVALRAPEGGYALTLSLSDTSAVTSGSYERFFEKDGKRYHHILDPETLSPAESGLVSATVVARNGFLADALSTALFVMGPERAADYWRTYGEKDAFEILLLTEDHRVIASRGLVSRIVQYGEGWDDLVIVE